MDIILIGLIIIAVLFLMWFITFTVLFMVALTTPAGVWIASKITRKPILCLHFKDGVRTRFIKAKKVQGNFAYVKGFGYFELAKDTANFDLKGKVVWYNALAENAKTQQLYKAALITELKETGFKIESWKDLKAIIEVVTNKEAVLAKYNEIFLKSKEKAERFKIIARNIIRGSVDIVWNKTYKYSVLYNLFSNDYNPAAVNETIHIAVMEDRKKRDRDYFLWVIIIAILLIVGAVAYTIVKSTTAPSQIILEVTPAMLKNGSNLIG